MSRKHILLITFFFVLTLLFVGVNLTYTFRVFDKKVEEEAVVPSFAIPEFQLMDQEGSSFGTEQLKGQVWIANFIFTRCPGPCLNMTRHMAALQGKLQTDTSVRLVTFTVDPDHDSAGVLKAYGALHGADWNRWTFLTGDRTVMHELIAKGFKLSVVQATEAELPTTGPYIHSTLFVVVGKDGKTRGYVEGSSADFPEKMQTLLEKVQKEGR